jgi:hypothetical protein
VHEADQPDVICDLFDAYVLASKHATEIDLAPAKAQAAALGDGDGHIVERIAELGQAGISSR